MVEKLRCMTSVYLKHNGKVLLLYRQGGRVVNDVWVGSAGGHFEKDELNDPRACVLRELQEELGVTKQDIRDLVMKYVTLRRTNGEIRQNYYFFADLQEHVSENLVSNEGKCKWFDYEEITELDMPLSAKYMMQHYLETGRYNEKLYCGITEKERMVFVELTET